MPASARAAVVALAAGALAAACSALAQPVQPAQALQSGQSPTSARPALWSGWSDSLAQADQWRWVVSPYTQHWRPSDEHRHVWALGVERAGVDGRFWGLSYFTNSFGQPSAYAYIGQRYDKVLGQPSMFVQWSGGVMYGYTGKYQRKVPLNVRGFSPGFVPSLGFRITPQATVQYNLLGDAGVMFQLTHDWR